MHSLLTWLSWIIKNLCCVLILNFPCVHRSTLQEQKKQVLKKLNARVSSSQERGRWGQPVQNVAAERERARWAEEGKAAPLRGLSLEETASHMEGMLKKSLLNEVVLSEHMALFPPTSVV